MIAKITKAYVRTYSDNGQTTAYVEWVDERGRPGRTEGPMWRHATGPNGPQVFYSHMQALFARAKREGAPITREHWR